MGTTEQTETEQTDTPAAEQTEAPTPPEADAEPTEKAGKEAARYRRQLRETEGALQAAQGATEAAQRALVEHLAQSRGVKPAALWASGAELAALLTEDGNVDPQKVTEAAEGAAVSLGLARTPRPDPTQGQGHSAKSTPKFADAFSPVQ